MDLVEDDVVAAAVRNSAVRKHGTYDQTQQMKNGDDTWKEAANVPPLLVPSLMTEELRDGKCGAQEEATGVVRLLRVAVRLHSTKKGMRVMLDQLGAEPEAHPGEVT